MSDLNGPMISDSINNAAEGITSKLNDIGVTNNTGLNKVIEGLTQLKESVIKTEIQNLPQQFADVYEKLAISVPHITQIRDALQEEADSKEASDSSLEFQKAKSNPNESDLTSLPMWVAAPPLYIISELKKIFDPKTFNIGNTDSKSSSPKGKGPNLDFSDKGWQDLAITLVTFANASKALNPVTLTIGTIGLELLAKFIDRTVEIFNENTGILGLSGITWGDLKKKMEEANETFSALRSILSNIFVSVLFASAIAVFIIPATIALIGISIFLLGVAGVGLIAGLISVPLAQFNTTTILVGISMMLFAATIFIISNTITTGLIQKTFQVVISTGLLLVGFGLLGILAMFAGIGISALTATSILLLVAIGSLALVFLIIDKLPPLEKALEKVSVIGEFFVSLIQYIPQFYLGVIASISLAAASIVLLIGSVLLLGAILVLEYAVKAIQRLMAMKVENAPGGLFGAIGFIGLLFLSIALLSPILQISLSSILLLAISSTLLLVSFIMLTITLTLGLAISNLMTAKLLLVPLWLTAFFMSMTALGPISLIMTVVAISILIASVLLLGIFISLTLTIVLATTIQKLSNNVDSILLKNKILDLFNVIANPELALKSMAIVLIGAPVLAASVMMLAIFGSIAGAYAAIQKLNEIQNATPDPSVVFGAVGMLADLVRESSEKTEGASILALAKFKVGIGAITEAVALIVDTILKLSQFSSNNPEGQTLLLNAQDSLGNIINKFFGVGENASPNSLLSVLEGIGGISRSQAKATQALVPLTEAIDNITGTVLKVTNIQREDIINGVSNLIEITRFVNTLDSFVLELDSKASRIKKAVKSTEEMFPLLENLGKISRSSDDFGQIRINISEMIAQPLLDLVEPRKILDTVVDSVKKLNSELSKLSRENRDTLKSIGQIGNGNTSGIGSVLGKIGGLIRGDNKNTETITTEDPLISIAKDVKDISKKLDPAGTSWTDKR